MPKKIRHFVASIVDEKLGTLQKAAQQLREHTPRDGWLKQIRSGLGMPEQVLANRLGIKRASLQEIERNERSGKATVDTLRRAAAALDADFVYAIIPRAPLHETVATRAREVAISQIAPVSHSMAMENQSLSDAQKRRQIDELAKKIEDSARDLWR